MMQDKKGLFLVLLFLFALTGTCHAETGEAAEKQKLTLELTDMSLEELMNIKVTSVSKRPEKLSHAEAAVFVITQEDIRRTGVTSIPEALRMVPGVEVARIDANKWAISARGFTRMFADKLLVLIDGRTVYTPLFSGVYWDVQDTLIEDVERIEVIRGPGASLWGANAVNGVINIITKHAKDTQGGLLSMTTGTEENAVGGVRYGGKINEETYYRFYTKYLNHDDFVNSADQDMNNDWEVFRSGFRVDSGLSDTDSLTVQGDIYGGGIGSTYQTPILQEPYAVDLDFNDAIAGANLLSRWNRFFSDSSDISLQMYYDWTKREINVGGEERDTFDLDFQHHIRLNSRNDFLWGLGYRYTADSFDESTTAALEPSSRSDHLFSLFIQDEMELIEELLKLTVGSKFEHNDYTGFEYQPTARLLWTPHPRHAV